MRQIVTFLVLKTGFILRFRFLGGPFFLRFTFQVRVWFLGDALVPVLRFLFATVRTTFLI